MTEGPQNKERSIISNGQPLDFKSYPFDNSIYLMCYAGDPRRESRHTF
jgi:hypothetical protein